MAKLWTPDEEERLVYLVGAGFGGQAISEAMGRTPAAVYKKAAILELSINGNALQLLLDFLERGGVVMQEDCGGAVGERWFAASRSGVNFSPETCRMARAMGMMRQERHGYVVGRI